ncbi:hypothetical protein QYF36_011694 [Acer negundo]|nr:hypothetical protein QYF36_011694 [Acer negundo]
MTKTKHLQNHISNHKNPKPNGSSSSHFLLADYGFLKTTSFPNLRRAHVKPKRVMLPRDSVAFTTYSMEPCKDFRQSMTEIVVSRIEQNLAVDWNYIWHMLQVASGFVKISTSGGAAEFHGLGTFSIGKIHQMIRVQHDLKFEPDTLFFEY